MKINLNTTLKNLKNEQIVDKDSNPITIRGLLIDAVGFENENRRLTGLEKVKAYTLAMNMTQNDEVNLTPEDIVFIKQGSEQLHTYLVYGQLSMLFDGLLQQDPYK